MDYKIAFWPADISNLVDWQKSPVVLVLTFLTASKSSLIVQVN